MSSSTPKFPTWSEPSGRAVSIRSMLCCRWNRAVWIGRIVVVLTLGGTAAALGFASFWLLSNSERDFATYQFHSIAELAVDAAIQITTRKSVGSMAMAQVIALANSDADQWPNVTVDGYEAIAESLIEASSGRTMAFGPLVTPEQLAGFEEFAYNFFYNEREPPFPNTTAVSSFGRGVWGVDRTMNSTDNRYHEGDGLTEYGSPYQVFAPILQHSNGARGPLMLNMHWEETRGRIIDYMFECIEDRNNKGNPDLPCGGLSDKVELLTPGIPGAVLMQPIVVQGKLVGVVGSSVAWDEVITNVFSDSVSGVDCVVTTDTLSSTYRITNGVVNFKGLGVLVDEDFMRFGVSGILTSVGNYSAVTPSYTLSIYPCQAYFDTYSTDNPRTAMIGVLCIVLICGLIFCFYDCCVRREFDARRTLLEAKRMFVRFISHEVRTPLNSVVMGLELLQSEMATSSSSRRHRRSLLKEEEDQSSGLLVSKQGDVAEWQNLSKEILSNAESSIDVLNDLLNYDKIESGKFTLELEVIHIWKLIEATTKEFKLSAEKKNVGLSLTFRHDDQLSARSFRDLSIEVQNNKVVGDPIRIRQVIRNLISNAIKFTSKGGIRITVFWSLQKDGPTVHHKLQEGVELVAQKCGELCMEVTDSGAGMTQAQVDQLFQQGVQFNVNRLQAGHGSGLGLFIAKGLVMQHGGSLGVRSPGMSKGTTFSMKLPLYHIPDQAIKKHKSESDLLSLSQRTFEANDLSGATPNRLHVLVVDDSITNRRFLIRWLEKRGHTCVEASDGAEAVNIVEKLLEDQANDRTLTIGFDSILIDYEMPRMNGPPAVEQIRKLGCESFIVGITGNILPADIAIFRKAGANAVLSKPLRFADLEALWSEYGLYCRSEGSSR